MTIYYVFNNETGYSEEFFKLTQAKAAMKKYNAKGVKERVYANGDSVVCGEILLKGNNKTFVANTRQTKAGY